MNLPSLASDIVSRIRNNPDSVINCENLVASLIKPLADELHAANQAASDNADWFDALVRDLSQKLGCEAKPTAIMERVEKLNYTLKLFHLDSEQRGLCQPENRCAACLVLG